MCSLNEPTFTPEPTMIVGIWLDMLLSSSSHVTISRLLCVFAHWAYGSMLFFSHVSPWPIVPSCMSSIRFGSIIANVGSDAKFADDGNSLNFLFTVAGRSLKLTHGACLRAYSPDVHAVEPSDGRLSEKP